MWIYGSDLPLRNDKQSLSIPAVASLPFRVRDANDCGADYHIDAFFQEVSFRNISKINVRANVREDRVRMTSVALACPIKREVRGVPTKERMSRTPADLMMNH